MNFGEHLFTPEEEQPQINSSWVPVTPRKPIQIRSSSISGDWQENQKGEGCLEELTVPGSGYMKEMLQYKGTDQNIHVIGQTEEYNNFDGGSAESNRVINHIAGSYNPVLQFDSNRLKLNSFELLTKNATNITSANRSLSESIDMAARTPLVPTFHPHTSCNGKDSSVGSFTVNQSNNFTGSDTVYTDANLSVLDRRSEFDSSISYSFLNNDMHCTFSSLLNSSLSEIPNGGFYIPCRPKYDLNSAPVTEADDVFSFINTFQLVPETMDQLNEFAENRLCTLPEYTTAENQSQEKDKQENMVASTENEYQEYCDGLLQHIVNSSSAPISTPYCKNKDSENNNSCSGSDPCFDLNKTPEQKAPKRRKHRPKVIVEGKPKRTPKPATQKKTGLKENPTQKRKYVRKNIPKEAATPQTDAVETLNSTTGTKRSCRKALNFDLEESRYEDQNKIIDQQEIQHANEKGFQISSDYQVTQLLSGANVRYATNSALLLSKRDGFTVENEQPRSTDGIMILLNQKLTDKFMPENVPLSATREQINNLSDIDKGPAQANAGLCQESNSGCLQQCIHADGISNVPLLSDTSFENLQKTNVPMSRTNLHLVPNILSNSIERTNSRRNFFRTVEKQHVSATNPPDSSVLHQEIFQVDENFNGTPLNKDLSKARKRKKTQNRLGSQKVRRKGKKESQSQFNNDILNCSIEGKRFGEEPSTGATELAGDGFGRSGAPNQVYSTTIDEVVCRLKDLNIGESNIPGTDGQNAIVLYNKEVSVVPYEGFEFLKKHKPRPKVDLDPETERTWKLLMGNEGSEGLEGTDKEKEKWWEEEREVFRGRANSFIARMHLVQGDRRFSQWKGSVVDSVIGVFLTQNVSDHLSSSAFMSLAARFPLRSASDKRSCCIVGRNKLVEEPEACIVNQDDMIISHNRRLSQPTYHEGFVPPQDTREHWRDSGASRIERNLKMPNNHSSEEEIISSQDSLDSSITEATRGIRSCSSSNSEAEGPTIRCEPSKTQFLYSTNSLQVGKTMFQEFYSSVNGVSLFDESTKNGQVLHAEYAKQKSSSGRKDSLISHSAFNYSNNLGNPQRQVPVIPSTYYELQDPKAYDMMNTFQMHSGAFFQHDTIFNINELQDTDNRRVRIPVGRSVTEKQCGPLGSQELPTTNLYEPLSMNLVHLQDNSQSGPVTNHYQPLSNHDLADKKILQPNGMLFTESISTPQKLGRGQDDTVKDAPNISNYMEDFHAEKSVSVVNQQAYSDNSTAEPQPQEQLYSSGSTYKERKLKVSKARKIKPETEKKKIVDWDNLRKQVQANGRKKERGKETMDSLDYEAVRCASVREISDTIKERGMNNMLAERIKDFLNRLVREHESIDLEWLRDVPPDKAKDYLLSIRGLGLKSVECVRLLTLHHLAFPVDTNVGRIAVRLGWVPLQPLPESLQLHLLELYPVLESIQKYLWPRLCKLDQRTLYELHYQMITFGKVFCTKSKPNCNACPMRAECRHFASAFASARLALPGPEEKGIVSIPVIVATERNPSLSMNPVLLPLPDNNLRKEASSEIGWCEPIIEVPSTPEEESPDTEALESDIEDSFWQDPDEIPTIKLNKEKFTMNIQNIMQQSMELQEGDMSKALVALNPDTAFIPTPKLKNVSRLRTEHQVYELPDSHPLLEKMNKREPDDPSPYLLAIWTPGETANSIEPPERRCISQDLNNLCNDKTCHSCNSIREANLQTVRGTVLIPCRTATRGSFPLNGTYFQVNEVFADHASSIQPLDVPREWIWNLPRRTVYFGTSVSTIFKGLSTQGIQQCFWRGFVCVRGFDQETRAPRPLMARLHFPASKKMKTRG